MRKTALCATLLAAFTLAANAQQILEDDMQCLRLRIENPGVSTDQRLAGNVKFTALSLPEHTLSGEIGTPALPVQTHIIALPFCQNIEIEVSNARYDTLDALVEPGAVYPIQPPRHKSDTSEPTLVIDNELYATDAFHSLPLASVRHIGIGRDRNLAVLSCSPVSINPLTGQVIVCRSAEITLRYTGADLQRTLDHYYRYHSPVFSPATTLNNPFAKITPGQTPQRMAIVVGDIPGIRENTSFQRFVEWKRTQGMLVDLIYTSSLSSNTTAAIAAAIKNLYLNATTENPAPTYLLLVGDHEQLPAFNCQLPNNNQLVQWYDLDDHVTDHYYTLWDSDNIRDCYLGRFSATDTISLNNMINKTLLYEKYEFADDSYLARGVLISGVDGRYANDNAYRCADPTMDYIARYYINADNGYTDVTYYKNNTSFAPAGVTVTGSSQARSTAAALRNLYNQGIGWINYSAHGLEEGWGDPQFYNNHVNQMTNNGKPSFMIGNCCLTNHFNTDTCFGEALLRKDNNAGAIGYIGGTNSTFWDEDFYFAVGVRDNISNTMNPSYNDMHLGSYDRLFHTHGETFSNRISTAGAIVQAGLMSVNSRNTSTWERDMIEYYWEIYELMGDPSLMPWLGTAQTLELAAVRIDGYINIETAPYAYVALVAADLSLIAAVYTNANGTATLEVSPSTDLSSASFCVTAQNYRPLVVGYTDPCVGIQRAKTSTVTLAPNPATDRCIIQGDGLYRVELLDMMGRRIQDARCSGECEMSLSTLPAGLYLVRSHAEAGVSVKKLIINK